MKKLLPLLLVCVLLVVALAATGCKSDELQAQIDTNNANAQTAIQEAAQKAADDLAAAKSALEALVAAGDKANADDLTAALADLNAAIDAAEAAAANADTGIKTYLKAAVDAAKAEAADAVAELKTELTEKIDAAVAALEAAAATDAEALTNAVAELTNAIDAVETAAAAADATLKTELEAAIATAVAALETELTEKIDAAVAALEAADAANTQALTDAVAVLNAAVEAAKAVAADADATLKTELEGAIATAVAALKTELTDKIDAAVAELAAADAADAQALTDAVATLNNAVEAAKAAAADADAALKTELEGAIAAAVGTLKTELTEKINVVAADLADLDGTKIDAEEYYVAIGEIWETIGSLMEDYDALDGTYATDAELAGAIANLDATLGEKIDGVVADLADLNGTKVDAEEYYGAIGEIWETIGSLTEAHETLSDAVNKLDATYATDADVDAKIEAAVEAAVNALTEKIDAAVAELAAADAADAQALTDAVAALNAAVEAAKAAAADADAALKTELEGAIATAVAALKTELTEKIDAAVAALEAADAANTQALTNAVTELTNAIDAVETAAAAADATLKTELEAAIATAVAALKTELTDKIDAAVAALEAVDATKVNAIEYNAKIEELEGLIQTLTGVNADLDKTYATDVDVDAKIAEAIAALKDAYIAIGAWSDATEVVNAALEEIKDLFDAYSTPLYADYADDISAAYDVAWILIVRAIDTDAVNTAKGNYKTYLEELPTPGALVYEALKAIAADVDGVKCTADVRKALEDLRDSIDELMARDPAIEAEIKGYIPEEGAEAINLDEKCTEYQAKYDDLKAAGAAIKADMDAVVAAPLSLTLKDGNVVIDAAYDAWIAAGNEATEIDGFVDSKTAYDAKKATIAEYETKGNDLKAEIDAWLVANPVVGLEHETAIDELIAKYTAWMTATNNDSEALINGLADSKANIDVADARVETLKEAKTVAANINNQINAIVLVNTGDATKTVKTTLEGITNQINAWVGTYGLGTDAEKAYGENYNLVHHDQLAALYEKFDELVGDFMTAFEEFMNAYNAIGDVNLLSRDEIAAARKAYDAWSNAAKLATYDYELTGGIKPVDYTVSMLQKESEYKLLVEDALAAYEARFDAGLTVDTVTIYNVAEVELIESWYAEFGVIVDGEYVFEDGYYLSEDITVTADDYAKVVDLRAAFDELVAVKITETETLQGLIDDLADDVITTDSRAKIDEALAARKAWLEGGNAPAGYTADQFKISVGDPTYVIDDAALNTANSNCEALENEAAALNQLIANLPAYTVSTDIVDDVARATYEGLINDIRTAQATFEANNDGNRGCVDYAKVEAGELAIVKYDTVVALKAEAALWTAEDNFVDAVDTVIANATAAIDAADADAVATVAAGYSAKLGTLNTLQTEYKAALAGTADADAETAIGAVCDSAIAYVIDEANTADDAAAEVVIANAKFDSLVEVAGAYATAAAGIDPADEINLGALKTAYTDYIENVKAAETDTEVANATSAVKELFTAIVDAANA